MNFVLNILNQRKPLWLALSDLFLDTELQNCDLECIANAMKKSGYSLDEIENILMQEVFPSCISNLRCPAGEWSGLNEAWLYNSILKAKRPNRFHQWINKRRFWMIQDDWEAVVKLFNE